jgi:hypothetical protein
MRDASIELCVLGLDPAQPCFQADSPDIRLDPSDADFIDVIHTNGRGLVKMGLGLPQPIGELFPPTLGHIITATIICNGLSFMTRSKHAVLTITLMVSANKKEFYASGHY